MRSSYFLVLAIACIACGAATPDPPTTPAAGGAIAGACKSVATFTSSAEPQLLKDGCAGCHSGADPGATAAFDLASLGKNDANACSQALRAVNLGKRPQSAIIQAATGGQEHKGGKVADTQAFTSALLAWINSE